MATKEKTPNYTEAQTAEIVTAFVGTLDSEGNRTSATDDIIKTLAEKLGKTTKSIVAKLTKEGKYKAKTYTNKNGEPPTKKGTMADAIGKILRLSDGETDSLEKANKTALTKIVEALANSKPIDPTEEQADMVKTMKAAMIGSVVNLDADEAKSLARASDSTLSKLMAALEIEVPQDGDETQP